VPSTIIHLTCASRDARRRLIAEYLPKLSADQRRWFFVDLPPGLELCLLHARSDMSVRSDLDAWVSSSRAAGLIDTDSFTDASRALDSRLFFDQAAPGFYVKALVMCSVRAADLLRAGFTSDDVVAREVATLYTSLVPRLQDRQRALEHYATWLEQLGGPGANFTGDARWSVHDDDPTLGRLRSAMRRQTARLARCLSARLGADYQPARNMVADALVARLAHTQVVRLNPAERTSWEVGLARSLLRAAPASVDDS
jgi:hypothetical protein